MNEGFLFCEGSNLEESKLCTNHTFSGLIDRSSKIPPRTFSLSLSQSVKLSPNLSLLLYLNKNRATDKKLNKNVSMCRVARNCPSFEYLNNPCKQRYRYSNISNRFKSETRANLKHSIIKYLYHPL